VTHRGRERATAGQVAGVSTRASLDRDPDPGLWVRLL